MLLDNLLILLLFIIFNKCSTYFTPLFSYRNGLNSYVPKLETHPRNQHVYVYIFFKASYKPLPCSSQNFFKSDIFMLISFAV